MSQTAGSMGNPYSSHCGIRQVKKITETLGLFKGSYLTDSLFGGHA